MDVRTIIRVLSNLGVKIWKEGEGYGMDAADISNHEAPYELVKTMRASILVLGPLVARMGKARVSLPGGCAIGARPVNLHLLGLEALGAKIEIRTVILRQRLWIRGADHLDIPTNRTENLMMAAVGQREDNLEMSWSQRLSNWQMS
jgi:UDP-N-acetylglucosamine 1-carboxyvinyltransferase